MSVPNEAATVNDTPDVTKPTERGGFVTDNTPDIIPGKLESLTSGSVLTDVYELCDFLKRSYKGAKRKPIKIVPEVGGLIRVEVEYDRPRTPDCWCRTCRPVTMEDCRFVVCPDCGNKRCPKATFHEHVCTNSNEPGQKGSVYE